MKPLDYKELGIRVRKLRKLKGLTQEQLSEMADLSKNYLSDIERAKSAGSLDVYYRVASALEINLDFLLDISVPMESETYLTYKIKTLNTPEKELLTRYMDLLEQLKNRD